MTSAPATDAATRGELEEAFNAGNEFAHHGSRHCQDFDEWYASQYPRSAPDAPAPYTEPRKGDKVELRMVGTLGDPLPCDFPDHCIDSDCPTLWEFREDDNTDVVRRINPAAFADGRVRLVKAAAPSYEPGVYRSPSLQRDFLYVPGLTASPWIDTYNGGWVAAANVPSDLVPCDVVPRGEA